MSVEDAAPGTATPRAASAALGRSSFLRGAASLPTLILVVVCLAICLPLAIMLTPDQRVSVAGQQLAVGARKPDLTLAGPAQLVQLGNTRFDIAALRVYGPLRPQLTLGPVQRNAAARAALDPAGAIALQATAPRTIAGGFLLWYGWASAILLGLTLAAAAIVGCVRILVMLWRVGRTDGDPSVVRVLWRRGASELIGSALVAVTVTMVAWAGAGFLAYDGTATGLRQIRSLSDLVGRYYLSPSPAGPTVRGYTAAVIGDSRVARLGGPPPADASADDTACGRSSDSLAAELGRLTGTQVRNLACSGASIEQGLRGPQQQGGRILPPQVGVLKQMEGLETVVVAIGPNDLYWADFLRYCYGVEDCQDLLTQGEFGLRLAAFDREYADLLQDLNDLPGGPEIVVVTSYDAFAPDADCPDTAGPPSANGLSPANLQLLADLNRQLNDVLVTGAEQYDFSIARSQLAGLCQPAHPQLGRDLQGLTDPHPFHPTAIGVVRMAASVALALEPRPAD